MVEKFLAEISLPLINKKQEKNEKKNKSELDQKILQNTK